jgi:hypothetical protein
MMANNDSPKIMYMVIIAGRKQKDRLLTALSGKGCRIIHTFYGKGTANPDHILDSIMHEENKVLITCLVSGEESETIFNMLLTDFNFDEKDTGIAYMIPVDKVSY